MKQIAKASKFQFISGNLALDFVNTVGDRLRTRNHRDYFQLKKDLIAWTKEAGVFAGHRQIPNLKSAIELREALYRIMRGSIKSQNPAKADLDLLNRFTCRARAAWRLQPESGGFGWRWSNIKNVPYPLARIAEAASELLTSKDIQRLRECNDEHCGWLFIDRSQGRRRKWCSMQDCGNRAKVRSYIRRKKLGL